MAVESGVQRTTSAQFLIPPALGTADAAGITAIDAQSLPRNYVVGVGEDAIASAARLLRA